jgi:hypothetical protein
MIQDKLIKMRKAAVKHGFDPRAVAVGLSTDDYVTLLKSTLYMEQHPTKPDVSLVFGIGVYEIP